MALFRCASGSSGGGATITVTYSSDFYGETVTCSHGTKTYSKVATSSGTLEFSVDEEGTWTISCTIGSDTFSTTADVDLTYDAELVSLPNGETVLPTDDIETWLACAAITDKAYTTLSQVLGDSETYNALLGDSNACAYMKRSTTWSTDICASQYAMNLLGQYDTACDALLSDSTWASAIANSTYWESVLQPLVPVMTSDTTPSGTGTVIYGSQYSGQEGYKAFDGNSSTTWSSNASQTGWVGFHFDTAKRIAKVSVLQRTYEYHTGTTETATIQGSNTGNSDDWHDVSSEKTFVIMVTSNPQWIDFDCDSSVTYEYYRLNITAVSSSSVWATLSELQFYGRTTSSEKIHGGNPTYDSFYYIDGGNNVPVTDPSLLDAGTYTIYSNGLAKDPDNLSNDYGKTVRICPNTKEIVVRPDNTLYWYGVMPSIGEDLISANGWSWNQTMTAGTHNAQDIQFASSSNVINGVASKYSIGATTVHAIYNGLTASSNVYGYLLNSTTKSNSGINDTQTIGTSGLSHSTLSATGGYAICLAQAGMAGKLSALWYE